MPRMSKAMTEYLEEMQHTAYVAEILVDAISACGSNSKRINLVATLAEQAQEVLKELGAGLDSVNLAKVES